MVVLNKMMEQSSAIQPVFMPQVNVEDIDVEETDEQPELTALHLIFNVLDEHLDAPAVFDLFVQNTAGEQNNVQNIIFNGLQGNLQDVLSSLDMSGLSSEVVNFQLSAGAAENIPNPIFTSNEVSAHGLPPNATSNAFDSCHTDTQSSQQENAQKLPVDVVDEQPELSIGQFMANTFVQHFVAHPAFHSLVESIVNDPGNFQDGLQQILQDVLPLLGLSGALSEALQFHLLAGITKDIVGNSLALSDVADGNETLINVVSNAFVEHDTNQPSQQGNTLQSPVATIDLQFQSINEIILNAFMQHPAINLLYEATINESSNIVSVARGILSDILPSLGMTGMLAQAFTTLILADIEAEIAAVLQQNVAASNKS